ncbi:MAG TPA: CPBP family intramembrane glutamic endopeptidase [Anaerolineales bacterium]|jgi:membrane protease YdiL (CAAX protease family)|nr:CPBP family intramembrane glutamic endopeptidase [Anaerolineales bacterium]
MNILYNPSEHRLRALWRLLIQFLVGFLGLGVLNLLAAFVIAFLLILTAQIPFGLLGDGQELIRALNGEFEHLPVLFGVRSLVVLLFVGLIYGLLARWLDRRPWREYGFHFNAAWWRDLGFGLLLGAVLTGTIFGVEYLLGWVAVTGTLENGQPQFPFWQLLVSGLFAYVFVGVSEELFARGYSIRNLAEGLNLPRLSSKAAVLIAYLLTSIVFGFLHGNNPNATLASSLNLALAGLFLGLGFVLTGELAIPVGLHITWNFFMGHVFGFPVSGVDDNLSLIAARQSGPAVWTGGAFGPEGGLLGVAAILLGMLLVWAWVRWTRRQASLHAGLAEYSVPHEKGEASEKSWFGDYAEKGA